FSIPNIYHFRDTDGDGRSDKKELFLGRFGFEKDTHGLTSHFTRGYDGWLYADHGFNNDSTLTAKDGSSIKLNSGNIYRIKPDGSHIEQFTWGQVNPFGLMFDQLGDLWSSDCHSSPLYLLLRGGYYPSFGKPTDGLGFAPNICEHSHGSTAIAGMVFYAAANFPAEFRDNTFIGNVMTCRINRDSFIVHGSTRLANEEPDFLSSDDPWFRPVDLQLGPDGALYVADFYNRIIGHYEVPLDNPGRDRERGRIWRIVYSGAKNPSTQLVQHALALPVREKQLVADLADSNIARRMLAMNELSDHFNPNISQLLHKGIAAALRKTNRKPNHAEDDFYVAHALWILHRSGALADATLIQAAEKMGPLVRVHALRIIADLGNQRQNDPAKGNPVLPQTLARFVRASIIDSNGFVRRAACEALGIWQDAGNLRLLLDARQNADAEDSQLIYVLRMSLRNQLLRAGAFADLGQLSEKDSRAIADVALGIKTAGSARFFLEHVQKYSEEPSRLAEHLRHVARYADAGLDPLVHFAETKFANDIDFQVALFKSVKEGSAQRGIELGQPFRAWGGRLAQQLLQSIDENSLDWRNTPLKTSNTANPWFLQARASADGDKSSIFFCSLPPGGESLMGVLRSKPFNIPAQLSFFMAGHDGSPEKPPMKKNLVRLRDVETKKIIASTPPPRNDEAQPFTWNLSEYAGRKGSLEIVDANNGHAFAWIAVGRLNPEVVPMPNVIPNQVDQRQQAAAELASALSLHDLEPQLAQMLNDNEANLDARAAAASALAKLNPAPHLESFGEFLANPASPEPLREKMAGTLAEINSDQTRTTLLKAAANAPRKLQAQIALGLASSAEGADALLNAVEDGKLSARLVQENSVRERLGAAKDTKIKSRAEKLVAGLTPLSAEKQKLIDERRGSFAELDSNTEVGARIFTQNCAVCHQLDGQGAVVGPQLDGVGNRGTDRLIEDILDPNRNVDRAFRTTLVVRKDGDVQSGLFRREEGEMVVLADSTGKEISIPKNEIKERRESDSSLMPDNFSDVISPEDFNHLISFLVSKGIGTSAQK
ncbi:MAG: c-type cytochrome, partial [Verrucomicrobiota bacterium]